VLTKVLPTPGQLQPEMDWREGKGIPGPFLSFLTSTEKFKLWHRCRCMASFKLLLPLGFIRTIAYSLRHIEKKKAKKNPAFRWQLRCTSFWVHLQVLGETSVQGTPPKKGLKNRASRYTETERHDFSTKTKQNKTKQNWEVQNRQHPSACPLDRIKLPACEE